MPERSPFRAVFWRGGTNAHLMIPALSRHGFWKSLLILQRVARIVYGASHPDSSPHFLAFHFRNQNGSDKRKTTHPSQVMLHLRNFNLDG
ncbi:MAG: hypothetical protein CMM01_11095 [Rhodopirellula sp.]|nr:hypothetical protein [Rhodopirellula sp.]